MDMHREASQYDRYTGESDPDAYPENELHGLCEFCSKPDALCDCDEALDSLAERPNPTEGK